MRRAPLALLGLAVLVTPAIVAAQSAQDKADAEVLFNAAKSALAAGNLSDACPKFAESQKKDPAIGTALYLAECYERSGKMASAWAEFRQAEDMANARHDNRAALAHARAERLVPSKLTIVLAPGADVSGLEVKRDGEAVGQASFGLASAIDGGKHVIVATAPNRRAFEWRNEIAEQRATVTVTIPKLEDERATPIATATATTPVPTATVTATTTSTATAPVPTAPHDDAGMSGVRVAGLVIGGVGLAAIGVGSIFGLVAHSTYDSSNVANGGTCVDYNTTPCNSQASVDARSTAFGQAAVATGLFIGGGVAFAGGLLMFFLAPKHKATQSTTGLAITPLVAAQGGGALLSGRF